MGTRRRKSGVLHVLSTLVSVMMLLGGTPLWAAEILIEDEVNTPVELAPGDNLTVDGGTISVAGANDTDVVAVTGDETTPNGFPVDCEIRVKPDGTVEVVATGTDGEGAQDELYAIAIEADNGTDVATCGTIDVGITVAGATDAYAFGFKYYSDGEGGGRDGEVPLTLNHCGTTTVTSTAVNGSSSVQGLNGCDDLDITIVNTGTFDLTGTSVNSSAHIQGIKIGGDSIGSILNDKGATISVDGTSTNDDAHLHGIHTGDGSDLDITNKGTVEVTGMTTDGEVQAHGIHTGDGGDTTIVNSGTVAVTGTSTNGEVCLNGIHTGSNGDATITNSGTVTLIGTAGNDVQLHGIHTGEGDDDGTDDVLAAITNSGTVTVTGTSTQNGGAYLHGIMASEDSSGTISNTGTLTVTGTTTDGEVHMHGIHTGDSADFDITNSGTVTVTGTGAVVDTRYNDYSDMSMHGIHTGYGAAVTVNNSGTLTVTGTLDGYYACVHGIHTGESEDEAEGRAGEEGTATITNSGTVAVSITVTEPVAPPRDGPSTEDGAHAHGIQASKNTSGTITNSGTLTVDATGPDTFLHGIHTGEYADFQITNSGTMTLTGTATDGDSDVNGIHTGYGADTDITNSGTITITSTATDGDAKLHGIHTGDASEMDNTITIINSGAMTATATATNGDADFNGIHTGYDADVVVQNSGTLTFTATADGVNMHGIHTGEGTGDDLDDRAVDKIDVEIDNSGTLAVTVDATDGDANVHGIQASKYSAGTIDNSGTLNATVTATGDIELHGIHTGTEADFQITNSGTAIVSATGDYTDVNAIHTGDSANTDITNSGTLTVISAADTGEAHLHAIHVGTTDPSYEDRIEVVNSGTITATATSQSNSASFNGIHTGGGGAEVLVENSGTATFTATGTEVSMHGIHTGEDSEGTTIDNSGTLTVTATATDGDADVHAVQASRDSVGIIDNDGTLTCTVSATDADKVSVHGVHTGDSSDFDITNAGTMTVTVTGSMVEDLRENSYSDMSVHGIHTGDTADVTVDNSGTLTVSATLEGDDGLACAHGIHTGESGTADIDNTGTITVTVEVDEPRRGSDSDRGDSDPGAHVNGIQASADSTGTIDNNGTLTVMGTGTSAFVHGIHTGDDADFVVTNGVNGVITATGVAEDPDDGTATVFGVHTEVEGSVIDNYGDITASATAPVQALARGIHTSDTSTTINNYGDIAATIDVDYAGTEDPGESRAAGVQVGSPSGYDDVTVIVNNHSAATISATATIDAPDADVRDNVGAVGIKTFDTELYVDEVSESVTQSRTIDNDGKITANATITADGLYYNLGAMGIKVGQNDAEVTGGGTDGTATCLLTITNDGTIGATAVLNATNTYDNVGAFGIRCGENDADNSASGTATATAVTTIGNTGTITVNLDLNVDNKIQWGQAGAYGIKVGQAEAEEYDGGANSTATVTTTITNSGTVTVGGSITALQLGDDDDDDDDDAIHDSTGFYGIKTGSTEIYTGGEGRLAGSATATTTVTNATGGTITVSGTIEGPSAGDSCGVYGIRVGNDETGEDTYQVNVTNAGTIAVTGTIDLDDDDSYNRGVYGIRTGKAMVTNTGSITSTGTFLGDNGCETDGAYGIRTGHGEACVVNAGKITVQCTDQSVDRAAAQQAAGIWSGGDDNVIHQSGTISATGSNAASVMMGCEGDGEAAATGGGNLLAILSGAAMAGDIVNAADSEASAIVFGIAKDGNMADFGDYGDAETFISDFETDALAGDFTKADGDANFSFTFSDDIGGGDLWNVGFLGGTTTLAGTNEFVGVIIAPNARVNAGFSATDVAVYGTLSIGNSIGQIEVDGDFRSYDGSTLVIEFNGDEIDQIVLADGGTAQLDDGTQIVLSPLGPIEDEVTYDFITEATRAITVINNVDPDDVRIDSLFYDAEIDGATGDITLTRVADLADFAPADSGTLGAFLDDNRDNDDLDPVIAALEAYGDADDVAAAMIEMSGQATLGVPDVVASTAGTHLDAMCNRAMGGVPGAQAGNWQVWAGGLVGSGAQDGSGYDWNTYGSVIGVDTRIGDLVLGLAFGCADTDYEEEHGAADGDLLTTHIGAYGMYDFGALFVTGAVSATFGEIDNERDVQGLVADSDTDQTAVFGQLGIGMDFESEKWKLTPFATLRYGYVEQDGYTEKGAGAFNLIVDDYDRDICETVLGVKAQVQFNKLTLRADATWEFEITDPDMDFESAFVVSPNATFDAEGIEPEDSCFAGGVGIDYSITEKVGVFATYRATVGSTLEAHNVFFGLRVALGK